MKTIFSELLGSQKDRTNLVLFPKDNLAFDQQH